MLKWHGCFIAFFRLGGRGGKETGKEGGGGQLTTPQPFLTFIGYLKFRLGNDNVHNNPCSALRPSASGSALRPCVGRTRGLKTLDNNKAKLIVKQVREIKPYVLREK